MSKHLFKEITDILVSFWQLTWRVILHRKRQVLFYYPQHFNRTAEGTNPFFDRLLDTCDRHGISYHLIEEPDWGTDKPRNGKAIKGDALFVLVLTLRKVVGLFSKKDFFQRERVVACIVNLLTFNRLCYDSYITISGSMLIIFMRMNPLSKVYDLQHGILYKQHPTFFDEQERLRPQMHDSQWHWLLWGRGYERSFIRGEEHLFNGRTHVIGYPVSYTKKYKGTEMTGNAVLFSLQFTHDGTADQLVQQKNLFEKALQSLQGMGVRVLLKHHPRYNNVISIDDLMKKYDFAELTTQSMSDLLPQVMLQVTVNSTTSFEYAEYGVPSFFIDPDGLLPRGALFYKEYRYPLYRGLSLQQVVERLKQPDFRHQDAKTAETWYREFYDEFDEQTFVQVIK